jgi:hypothetical protein
MLDGLWILQILPPPVATGGVAVFVNDKILGGDSGFSWVGTYRTEGRLIQGRVRVHNFDPDIKSVFGVDGDYDMHFTGTVEGDIIIGTGLIANQPQHTISVRLDRRANL